MARRGQVGGRSEPGRAAAPVRANLGLLNETPDPRQGVTGRGCDDTEWWAAEGHAKSELRKRHTECTLFADTRQPLCPQTAGEGLRAGHGG